MRRRELDALLSVQRWAAGWLPEEWDVRVEVESGREPARPYALVDQIAPAETSGAPFAQDVTVAYTLSLFLPEAKSRAEARTAALEVRELAWQAVKVGPDPARPTTDRIPLFCYLPRPAVQRITVKAFGGAYALTFDGQTTGLIAHDAPAEIVQSALEAVLPDGASVRVLRRGTGVFDVHFDGGLLGVDVPLIEADGSALVGAVGVRHVLRGAAAPWRSEHDWLRVTSFGQTTVRDPDDPKLLMVAVDLRCAFTRGAPVAWEQMLLRSVTAKSRLLECQSG